MGSVDFKRETWDLVRDITETMVSIFRPVAEAHGLTMLQMRVLIEARQEPHTVGSLGKTMCIAGANTSSLCKRLEQEGFLERVRDEKDERVVHIVLTKHGNLALDEIEETLQQKFTPVLASAAGDVAAILDGLGRLSRLLRQIDAPEPYNT